MIPLNWGSYVLVDGAIYEPKGQSPESKDRMLLFAVDPAVPARREIPFGPDLGGAHRFDAPFTGNEFLQNPDMTFRPECYAQDRMNLLRGTEIWVNERGIARLVAVFDPRRGFVPAVP
ncbi:hypothetical protein ACI3KS_08850 [Microbacterium sp. ZW T5_45]|uniref:hypothetical protein n=1 Tax=Microbacterium sp. ZW T5_45 TaxID=3378080 RepID=UPI00385338D5